MPEYKPNAQQQAVLDWMTAPKEERDSDNVIVNANAGTGKSSLLQMAARTIQSSGVSLAFNKHNAETLSEKLKDTRVASQTIHSLGFSAVRTKYRKTKVSAGKYRFLINDLRDEEFMTLTVEQERWLAEHGFPGDAYKLVDLVRADLAETRDDVLHVIDHHGLDIPEVIEEPVLALVDEVITRGVQMAWQRIDYTDMIYLPFKLNLRPTRYPWVLVDECQDLSAAQRDVVMRAIAPGGRVIAVGDPMQSIYGFAGADAESFYSVKDRLDAKELPLSVCYRCPTSHIALAQELCPAIEAAPGAGPGVVGNVKRSEMPLKVAEGDLVLSRYTAPLIGLCYELIRERISAAVKGRDIGKGLKKLADKVDKTVPEGATWSDVFADQVDAWERDELDALERRKGDKGARMEAVQDKAECLRVLFTMSRAKSLKDLKASIDELFAQDRPSVLLSTIHRAKGLENDRVFLLTMPDAGRCKREWQAKQEVNLEYVALTRAKGELYFIDNDA